MERLTALLTWLGKSDLPVATIFAPASKADGGNISGDGLLNAKTIGSTFIVDITLLFKMLPFPETPINTSDPFNYRI